MLPDAWEQARRLDNGWVGTEHVLLALLATPSIASGTLEGLGVTYERAAERIRASFAASEWPLPGYDREDGVRLNPAANQLMGRAEGFAAAAGHRDPQAEHWLLALVWSDHGAMSELHALGATQDRVLDGLRRRGVRVPEIEPPAHPPWREGESVEVDAEELAAVLAVLHERRPAGSELRWGFNGVPGKPGRWRVDAEEGIDLGAAVRAARARMDHDG